MSKRPWMCAGCGWRWFNCTCPVATTEGGMIQQALDGRLTWTRPDGEEMDSSEYEDTDE